MNALRVLTIFERHVSIIANKKVCMYVGGVYNGLRVGPKKILY